jgi:hypothetical protein
MTDELIHLRSSLAQLAGETRRRQGSSHPPPEALAAYAAGELQPAAAEVLLEHLAVCRSCALLLLGFPAFLAATGQEPEPRARPLRRRAVVALAACLAACLIALAAWMAAPGRSRVPPRIVAVNPPEQTLGETAPPGAPPPALRLDAEATALVLYLRAPQTWPSLRVEVLDREGKVGAPAAAAAIAPQAVLVLLTREQLPAGDYRFRVLGIEPHRQQTLDDYPLRILARRPR